MERSGGGSVQIQVFCICLHGAYIAPPAPPLISLGERPSDRYCYAHRRGIRIITTSAATSNAHADNASISASIPRRTGPVDCHRDSGTSTANAAAEVL
jgi:hypothetical protein